MTKEITKAYIIQEIEDKLKLRELEPSRFEFSETVVPIYNIEQHLRRTVVETKVVSITGTGGVTFFAVPQNEKWFVKAYTVIFLSSGAHTIAGVYVIRNDSGPILFSYLDLTAAQTTSYTVNLPKELELHSFDSLRINVDGYTSTANLQMNIDIEKEEIR